MSLNVVVGIDPGVTGGIAVLADGAFDSVHDMPVVESATGKSMVNGSAIAEILRDVIRRHPGAHVSAAVEKVGNMPRFGPGGTPIKMGASSMFNFGYGAGRIHGVIETLAIPLQLVAPATWKGRMQLTGKPKDYARTVAMQMYPTAAPELKLKKHHGRADAIMIARWAVREEIHDRLGALAGQTVPEAERAF